MKNILFGSHLFQTTWQKYQIISLKSKYAGLEITFARKYIKTLRYFILFFTQYKAQDPIKAEGCCVVLYERKGNQELRICRKDKG